MTQEQKVGFWQAYVDAEPRVEVLRARLAGVMEDDEFARKEIKVFVHTFAEQHEEELFGAGYAYDDN